MEISLDFNENSTNSSSNKLEYIGNYLGLDISENSTGVCILENGVRDCCNIILEDLGNKEHREVLLRRALCKDLKELLEGKQFDAIIIEDVFQGTNPLTTRLLYALNTAIDELIVDGIVKCEKFMRVSNQTWKKWLFTVDKDNITKGLGDKLKIEMCLSMLGIREIGPGYQDRLDATGMVVGYLLNKDKIDDGYEFGSKKHISPNDICVFYEAIMSDLLDDFRNEGIDSFTEVEGKRWSKNKILSTLELNPYIGYVTSEEVNVGGKLSAVYNLPIIMEGGYLGFCVKRSKLSKYIQE